MRYIKGKQIVGRYRNGKPVIARFRNGKPVFGNILPYEPLNFIQSDGDQYLLTNHKGTTDLNIKISYQLVDDSIDGNRLFGAYQVSAPTTVRYEATYISSLQRIRVGDGAGDQLFQDIPLETAMTVTQTLDFNKNGRTYSNGTDIGEYISDTADSLADIAIFTRQRDTGAIDGRGARGKFRIYGITFIKNSTGEILNDYIPVRKDTGEVCLYCDITKTYLTNAGDGSFIGG